jgi:hypothetical protein
LSETRKWPLRNQSSYASLPLDRSILLPRSWRDFGKIADSQKQRSDENQFATAGPYIETLSPSAAIAPGRLGY